MYLLVLSLLKFYFVDLLKKVIDGSLHCFYLKVYIIVVFHLESVLRVLEAPEGL